MSNIGSKAIYMSLQQLLIIFYQRKVDGILMPDAISEVEAGDRQLKEAMAKMIGDCLLVPDKSGQLALSEDAREIADIIAGAARIYHIGNGAMPQQFLYEKDGRGVLMNLDTMNSERARLEIGDARELIENITDYEGMPAKEQTGEAAAAEEIPADKPMEDVLDIPEVVTVVDRYLRGAEKAQLRVVVREGEPFTITATGEGNTPKVYDKELFVRFLTEEQK